MPSSFKILVIACLRDRYLAVDLSSVWSCNRIFKTSNGWQTALQNVAVIAPANALSDIDITFPRGSPSLYPTRDMMRDNAVSTYDIKNMALPKTTGDIRPFLKDLKR